MHFHQLLRWCHEAYEESLERFGISPREVFPSPGQHPAVALPIVHCSADYRRPLQVGDPLAISLEPLRLDPGSFEIRFVFQREGEEVARALTRHLAIDPLSRGRFSLPEPIQRWLEGSALGGSVRPL